MRKAFFPTRRWAQALTVLGAAVIIAGTATAVQAAIPDGGGQIHGCYSAGGATGTNGTPLNIIDNAKASCSKGQTAVAWGAQGPPGTNGKDGSSVVTSSGAPSGSCTTGDTDIDLNSGEVYTCPASAWQDTGKSLQGPQGQQGPPGTAFTWTVNCFVMSAHDDCGADGATSIPAGAVLTPVSATITGSSCSNWEGGIADSAGHVLATVNSDGSFTLSGPDTTSSAGPLSSRIDTVCNGPSTLTFTFNEIQPYS